MENLAYPKASFRKTTHVPQHRHNVAHRKSYTEVNVFDTTKSIPKFSSLRLKRSDQDTGYGEGNTKGTHFSTGPATSSRHSKKNLKLQTVPPQIC